jgi:DNA repair exonuclease SbcCD ATPase subunit
MGSNDDGNGDSLVEAKDEVRDTLRFWRNKLGEGPLEQERAQEILSVLTEIADMALEQAIENGRQVTGNQEQLELLKGQLDTIIPKIEANSRIVERIDEELTNGLKELKTEVSEVRDLVASLANHLGVPSKKTPGT